MNRNITARHGLFLVGLILIAAPAVSAQPARQGRNPGIEGRWNLTVTEGEAVYPSWLGVEKKDDQLVARFLGRAGSVGGTEDFKFADGTVSFKAHGREWTGKLDGRTIEGTWSKGDQKGKWTAQRSVRRINVSGKWNLKVNGKDVTMNLTQARRNITGTWSQDGKETQITGAQMRGGNLAFTVDGKQYSPALKGDVMEGRNIKGRREREWAKPIELFNGKQEDLANWQPLGENMSWTVVDGVMSNGKGHTENLVTKRKDFRNFKLHVEFKVPEKGNSGVYLRGRHEVQIADSYGKPIEAGGCGAMYSRVLPKVNASKPAGEWQTFDIEFIDNYLTVVHNDQVIMDNVEIEGITGGALDSNEWEPGPIYLQGDHSQIFYRKVILTPAK